MDIYTAFKASTCKEGFAIPVRSFLKYLFKKGLHDSDLSHVVPMVRRSKPVPSVYSKQETDKILSSIDRTKPIGRRDYAAILLALRLGMRAGDIKSLKTSDINHEARTIEFVQEKTLVPQRLELLPEIEDALTAYLSERVNPQGSPYVFLSVESPFNPLIGNFVGIAVSKHIAAAGVNAGERKRGSHAMRMTLASELAAESVPYDVIRKILGHENPESIRHYVKLDIVMLRKCAIDSPQPVGRLAECLRSTTGGEV
jgi:integrase